MDGISKNLLWHYCSEKTFGLILTNKTIRLSDVTKCLDKQELKYAKRKFASLLNNDISPIIDTFPKNSREFSEALSAKIIVSKLSSSKICWVFCISESDEVERHWFVHGDRGKGLSIGFSLEPLINNVSKIKLLPVKIVYGKKEVIRLYEKKKARLRKVIDRSHDKYVEISKMSIATEQKRENKLNRLTHECYSKIFDLLLADFASFKRHRFEWEKEWRLILTSTNLKRSLLAKNIRLTLQDGFRDTWDISFNLTSAIKAITIGKESRLTVDKVHNFLEKECSLTSEEIKNITIKKLC